MSEEDVELKDLVAQTLENNGLLAKIRAEIRASVFLAIEEHENFKENDHYINKTLKTFVGTNEGSLVTCLVREFLEFFELDFTLSVFDPETCEGKNYNYAGRSELINALKMDNLNGKKVPLLLEILHLALAQKSSSGTKQDIGREKILSLSTEKSHSQYKLNENKPNIIIDLKNAFVKDLEVTETKENSSSHSREAKTMGISLDTALEQKTVHATIKTKQSDIVLSSNLADVLSPRSLSASDSESSSHNNSRKEHEKSKGTENSVPSLSTRNAPKDHNKTDIQVPAAALSSLSNLPPLFGIGPAPELLSTTSLPNLNQAKDMHKIKAMIDLGLDSHDNYDEDFNSSVTGSGREGPSNHGTDSEIEEELGFGEEDLLSSTSAVEDMTAELSIGTITGIADYLEDVK